MSRQCAVSKKSHQNGHRVSHANNKTKHVFRVNLQVRRVYVPELKKFVKIRVSTRIIRTLDKLGLQETLRKYKLTVKELLV
ncbi:MAG: 50S ribosomal protein L28 [Oligoflexia bacterium]|nr:50S ribosomal protein L28 [Oligoflexia bacterium]